MKNNIVVFCHNFELNGANRFVLDLVKALKAKNNITLVSPFHGYVEQKAESYGFDCFVIPTHQTPAYLDKILSGSRPSIIVNTLMQTTTVLELAARNYDPLWVVHESWEVEDLENTLKNVWNLSSPTANQIFEAMSVSKNIVFPAKFAQLRYKSIIKGLGRVIYNGLNPENYPKSELSKSELKLNLGVDANSLLLSQVGTVCPRKNQMSSVFALKYLKDTYPEKKFHLLLVGARSFRKHEAKYIDDLKKFLLDNNLTEDVTILPTSEEIGLIYQATDVLLCPSKNEALPYVVVESMYYGIPVVASDVDGIPEAVSNGINGFLVPADDHVSLAKRCIEIIEKPELSTSIVSLGYEKVATQFSYENMIHEYTALISDISFSIPIRKKSVSSNLKKNLSKMIYNPGEFFLSRKILPKLDYLRSCDELVGDARIDILKQSAYELANHASEHVPYYRELFNRIGFEPSSLLENLDNLQKLPILKREDVLNSPEKFLDERLSKNSFFLRESNGSCGTVFKSYYSQEDLDWAAAVNLFVQEKTGKARDRLEVHVRVGKKNSLDFVKSKLKSAALFRKSVVIENYSDNQIMSVLKLLLNNPPYTFNTPPSIAMAVVLLAKKENISVKGLFSVLESVNEQISEKQLDFIKINVGCRIFNRYSLSEMGVVALGEDQLLMSLMPIAMIESTTGHKGIDKIIATPLKRFGMPLLRYETGDYGLFKEFNGGIAKFQYYNDEYTSQHLGNNLKDLRDHISLNRNVYEYQFVKDCNDTKLLFLGDTLEYSSNAKKVSNYGEFISKGRQQKFQRYLI